MRRILIVPALVLSLLVAGCGSSTKTAKSSAGAAATSAQQSASSAAGSTTAAGCPTSNTKSFAKTRFVADVGGALYLSNRYLLKPYKAGTFKKGAHGRTLALIKAAAAVAATTKLLKNAQTNAKANPTLCKSVSGPLTKVTSSLSGVVGGLKSGSLTGGGLAGLGGLLGTLQSKAASAGIPVKETSVPLK